MQHRADGEWHHLAWVDGALCRVTLQNGRDHFEPVDPRNYYLPPGSVPGPTPPAPDPAPSRLQGRPTPSAPTRYKVPEATLYEVGLPEWSKVVELVSPVGETYVCSGTEGSGQFGKLLYALDKEGKPCAVKIFVTPDAPQKYAADGTPVDHTVEPTPRHRILEEARNTNAMSRYLRVREVFEIAGRVYVVMTLAAFDIASIAQDVEPDARVALAQTVITQISDEVAEMHARGQLHGDLKLENMLAALSGSRIVLADFGNSAARPPNAPQTLLPVPHGMPTYPAPERPLSFASEVWSLAAAISEIFPVISMMPFEAMNATAEQFESFAAWRNALMNGGRIDLRRMPPGNPWTDHFSEFAERAPALCMFVLQFMLDPNPHTRAPMAWVATEMHKAMVGVGGIPAQQTAQTLQEMIAGSHQTRILADLQRYRERR
jgi:hypothetical protein